MNRNWGISHAVRPRRTLNDMKSRPKKYNDLKKHLSSYKSFGAFHLFVC